MRKKPKKKTYKSPETRARQLAGLNNVKIEDHVMGTSIKKVNGEGRFASVPEEQRQEVFDMYCSGLSCRAIEEKTGLSRQTVDDIKRFYLDHNSQFRETMFKHNLREKLQRVADLTADRVSELAPEMEARDAVLALSHAVDKIMLMEKGKSTNEVLHQHLHMHAPADIGAAFMNALKKDEPKSIN